MKDKKVLVIAPHPDDETLGCGGTLLYLNEKGYSLNWLIITSIKPNMGYTEETIQKRKNEIDNVSNQYQFRQTINLNIPSAEVEAIPQKQLVQSISKVFQDIKPNIVFLPFYNDVHTDHKKIAEAAISCCKWFRHPYIDNVLFYETISETNMNINAALKKFEPNVYVNIVDYLNPKIEIMNIYQSEVAEFPFPRSKKAIESLAFLRGSECGAQAAEAFELLRAIIK